MRVVSSPSGGDSWMQRPLKDVVRGSGMADEHSGDVFKTLVSITGGSGVVMALAGLGTGAGNASVRVRVDGQTVYHGELDAITSSVGYMDASLMRFGVDGVMADGATLPPLFFNDALVIETNRRNDEVQYIVGVFA